MCLSVCLSLLALKLLELSMPKSVEIYSMASHRYVLILRSEGQRIVRIMVTVRVRRDKRCGSVSQYDCSFF